MVEVVVGHLGLGFGALQFPLEPLEIISVPRTINDKIEGMC